MSCHEDVGKGQQTSEDVVVYDLVRAILEPDAEVVAGYAVAMPTNGLNEEQAADIVQYIVELTTDVP